MWCKLHAVQRGWNADLEEAIRVLGGYVNLDKVLVLVGVEGVAAGIKWFCWNNQSCLQ